MKSMKFIWREKNVGLVVLVRRDTNFFRFQAFEFYFINFEGFEKKPESIRIAVLTLI